MKEQSIPSIEQQSHPCIQPSDVHDFEQILLKREQSYAIMLENLTVYGVDVDDGNLSPAEMGTMWKEISRKMSEDQQETYAKVVKYGKIIDKIFKGDLYSFASEDNLFSLEENYLSGLAKNTSGVSSVLPEKSLHLALAHHFFRIGYFDIAESYLHECGLILDSGMREKFKRLFVIFQSLEEKNLSLAVQWAEETLKEEESDPNNKMYKKDYQNLLFQLYKLQYLEYISQGQQEVALSYASQKFRLFSSPPYLKVVKRLMSCLMYVGRLNSSPYADLFLPCLPYEGVKLLVMQNYSRWMGLSYDCPLELWYKLYTFHKFRDIHVHRTCAHLYVLCTPILTLNSMSIGEKALPKILKAASIMKDSGISWTSQDELPIEIKLPDCAKFHSVFTCPVLKESSIGGNPPMKIPCGHVISKEAVNRLSKASTSRFKCPYCPSESSASDALEIFL